MVSARPDDDDVPAVSNCFGFVSGTEPARRGVLYQGLRDTHMTVLETSAREVADYRRKKPTPYMERLRFTLGAGNTADLDVRLLSDQDLQQALEERRKRKG